MSETILVGVISFIATNLDDIVLLTLYFSQVDDEFRKRHVIIGQYLGFSVLLIVSLFIYYGILFIPEEWIGLLGFAPIAIGVKQLLQNRKPKQEEKPDVPENGKTRFAFLSRVIGPQTLNVASVTIAIGADNIGVYVPLFAALGEDQVPVVIVVFLTMLAIWLWISNKLSNQPTVQRVLVRYGHIIMPIVLIILGIFILVKTGTAALILGNLRGLFS